MTKIIPKKSISIVTVFIYFTLATILIMSCKSEFDNYYHNNTNTKGGYLFSKLQSNPNFSIFVAGLQRTSLDQYTSSGGLYTVFAPTDDAFKEYFKQKGYSSINDVPSDTLFNILSYHIVNNMWYYYDFKVRYTNFQQSLFLTRNKKFVNVDVTSSDTLKVNGFAVIKTLRDINAENGVIHGISHLLIPNANLEKTLASDPQLSVSTFYKLMKVCAGKTFDRFNSYDKNRDGKLDSVFYTSYPYLTNVSTDLDYQVNTLASDQGGDPVFTTIIAPTNAVLDPVIAPALAKIDNSVTDKIAALSPYYAQSVLESYFIASRSVSSKELIQRPTTLQSVNGEIVPAMTASVFVRPDIQASNGLIHVINIAFPASDRRKSAMGQAMVDPDLTTFWLALSKAGLLSTYAVSTRAGTYFAPTNAAFANAGLDVKNLTLNGAPITTAQLTTIMKHHVINSNLASASLSSGTYGTDLASTEQLIFGTGPKVTSAAGITANITLPAVATGPSNVGYVYKVDRVLMPL